MRKLNQFFSFFILIALTQLSLPSQAQQAPPPSPAPNTGIPLDELSLEEQLNNELGTELGTGENPDGISTDELMMLDETGLISPVAPYPTTGSGLETYTNDDDEDHDDDGSGRVRYIEPRYAKNGYSFGLQVWTQRFDIKASLLTTVVIGGTTTTNTVDLSSSSNDFQNIGFVGRYAIFPFDHIGADINVTAGTSLNHGESGLSSIHTIRAEFNLSYTVEVGGTSALYGLGGVGYETFIGDEIQKIVSASGGGTVQLGAGFNFSEQVSAEVMYMRAFHKVSDEFFRRAGDAAIAQGATSYAPQQSSVTAEIIQGRLMFTF
ncbi:hypothetical protein [Pseudobdellovibrio exovorus]|uniref:Outer membrane protein beta-barrel domain-containing protein n=1 Tax=Pseudobdellovibrio exovorus JSS TaxID=1184267 RepID=M4VBE9_9BACT|nr:hypothetical protein [Pseudobdellovibrio exovorus]AGH96722.1 hypothetical protein A11Q_2506 [Pseudobdellovibrio exovorus JSS]